MKINQLHAWNVPIHEAIQIQHELALRVQELPPLSLAKIEYIAGVDVSITPFQPLLTGAVIIYRADTFEIVETAFAQMSAPFPYIPGLLSFREIPVLLEAFAKIQAVPDVVMVDGQGRAHPRRLGIASHLGLFLDVPTIGVGKSPLVGGRPPIGDEPGASVALMDNDEQVGMVVRTKKRANPLYLSVGHKLDLD
ncbi:MAG: endonuclease V, partial [Candidatus Andersenbacteria bacterium]